MGIFNFPVETYSTAIYCFFFLSFLSFFFKKQFSQDSKYFSRMCTALLPTELASVATTRCQYQREVPTMMHEIYPPAHAPAPSPRVNKQMPVKTLPPPNSFADDKNNFQQQCVPRLRVNYAFVTQISGGSRGHPWADPSVRIKMSRGWCSLLGEIMDPSLVCARFAEIVWRAR